MNDKNKIYLLSGVAVSVVMLSIKGITTVINKTVAVLLGV